MKYTYSLRNEGSSPLEVMVEPTPDRFVLAPGQELTFNEPEDPEHGIPLSIIAYDGGITIWPHTIDPVITIDGKPAVQNWERLPRNDGDGR